MIPPNNLKIVSDDNELVFKEMQTHDSKGKKLKEIIYHYTYTLSETKLGFNLPLPLSQLEDILKQGIAIVK